MTEKDNLEGKCRWFSQSRGLKKSTIRSSYERMGCYDGCDGRNKDCLDYTEPRKIIGVIKYER